MSVQIFGGGQGQEMFGHFEGRRGTHRSCGRVCMSEAEEGSVKLPWCAMSFRMKLMTACFPGNF